MDKSSPSSQTNTEVAKPQVPHNEAIHVLNLYQTADKIYTRSLEGFYRSLRRWT